MTSRSERVLRFVGVDPGLSGGIACVARDGRLLHVAGMPETLRETWDLLKRLDDRSHGGATLAVLEAVHSSPQMGVSSSFKFGKGFGALEMALVGTGIRHDLVTPQAWQKAMGLIVRGRSNDLSTGQTEKKNMHKERAQQMFPGVKVTHALADALLLAEFARRREVGELAA